MAKMVGSQSIRKCFFLLTLMAVMALVVIYVKIYAHYEEVLDNKFVNSPETRVEKKSREPASSGSEFTGERVRYFGDYRRKFKFQTENISPSGRLKDRKFQPVITGTERSCTNWAVVTTIHEPSESVRRMLYLINRQHSTWCMVIVGDLELPSTYEFVSTLAHHKNVVFLNSDEQKKISQYHGPAFVESLPWHSFGRKNVGFAYAIAQEPKPSFVWDFDDDNQLKFWIDHANLQEQHSLDNLINSLSSSGKIEAISINTTSYRYSLKFPHMFAEAEKEIIESKREYDIAYNPYPALGCQLTKCWPRGFPLSQIEHFDFMAAYQNVESNLLPPHYIKSDSISIIQSVADHKPDVDAIFRLTVSNQPFSFGRNDIGSKQVDKLLIIPKGFVVPMNAQATLHARSSFFGLYLPWTVNGRVSDIWRSYIAQAILSLTDHVVAFAPLPLVDQDRNTDHGPMADYEAEQQLNLQIDALISRLNEWKMKQQDNFIKLSVFSDLSSADYFTQNLATLMEDLYIELYERKFLEEGDVISVQYWLQLLTCYGYLHSPKPEKCQTSSWNVGTQPVIPRHKLKHFAQAGNSENDYTMSTCPNMRQKAHETDRRLTASRASNLTFLNVDLHDGCRLDIPTLLASLGHTTILAGYKGHKTPYSKAHTRNYSAANKAGLIQISQMRSKTIKRYVTHRYPLKDSEIDETFKFYTQEGKSLMNQIDVFTSSFPPAMFQLWKPFLFSETQAKHRSVIIAAAHRYNLGRCSVREWNILNDDIKTLLTSPSRTHVAGGMSRYDLEYMYHYTGITKASTGYKSKQKGAHFDQMLLYLLPAISSFYTRPEVTQARLSLSKRTTLLTFLNHAPEAFSETLYNRFASLKDSDIHVIDVRKAYKRYELSDLIQYGAILYFPYSVMSYKLTELYSLNIPLMVPSLKYFSNEATFGSDRTSSSLNYCNDTKLGLDMKKAPNSPHPYNPNIMSEQNLQGGVRETNKDNKQHELYWLQFSDFYDWPHVTYFDNATHAADLFAINIHGQHFSNVRKWMEEENVMRRYFTIAKTWCPLLEDISRSVHVT